MGEKCGSLTQAHILERGAEFPGEQVVGGERPSCGGSEPNVHLVCAQDSGYRVVHADGRGIWTQVLGGDPDLEDSVGGVVVDPHVPGISIIQRSGKTLRGHRAHDSVDVDANVVSVRVLGILPGVNFHNHARAQPKISNSSS